MRTQAHTLTYTHYTGSSGSMIAFGENVDKMITIYKIKLKSFVMVSVTTIIIYNYENI